VNVDESLPTWLVRHNLHITFALAFVCLVGCRVFVVYAPRCMKV